MPHLIISDNASANITGFVSVLWQKNPQAAAHAAKAINKTLELLETFPEIGRTYPDLPGNRREIFIDYGRDGYAALYHIEGDTVIVLAVKHGRQAGYSLA